ncbi:acyl-CoA N-acyltransferase [Xylariaceae sp. FL1651]|nr:acyl-CoA N-acyltransferase [Xylariaceae sp. FL1651]
MPFVLQPATEADAERSAEIEKEAYAPDPFNKVLFPGPFPEPAPGQSTRSAELVKLLREDPTTRWLKVVDTDIEPSEDNRQMIGFAQWNINDGSEPPPKGRTFGPGCNIEACEAIFGKIHERRLRVIGDKKHVYPKHERKGAGRMLVMWGVEEAKKLGLPAFLNASQKGHLLYSSCGFRVIEKGSVDCTKWGMPAEHITYTMGRDP